jgi:ubiquinone/menaquinone biosynthesis C-methylase UbiE
VNGVGFYGEQVLPRIVDKACGMKSNRAHRERVCAALSGDVIEIGFGSGNNVDFYPDAVSKVVAVEPSDLAWKLARNRVEASRVPIERVGVDAQGLPLADDTFDAAVSTWTMCTIPDAGAALRELRRVLKPGGRLHFVEHGLAPDPRVQRWQHRLNGMQRRLFGGCNLDRPIAQLLVKGGFTITEIEEFYEPGAPKFLAADSLGVAIAT